MHEASIVEQLIEMAARRTPKEARLLEVRVGVGLLSGVSPDAMVFYFEALAPERLGGSATLVARLVPLRARCTSCRASHEFKETTWLCPDCSEPTLVFENGDELDLEGLLIDDGQADHDRTAHPQEERGSRGGEPAGD